MKYIYIPIYARNVLPSKETILFINNLKRKADKPQVRKWIDESFNRFITNDYPGTLHLKLKPDDPHWMEKRLQEGEQVFDIDISNTDKKLYEKLIEYLNNYPSPEKIKNIGSNIPQLIQMMEKDEKVLNKKKLKTKGFSIVKQYPNGYKWVELLDGDVIVAEGEKLDNCLQKGIYNDSVKRNFTKIYSLRDKNDNPHVAIEYSVPDKRIVQVKGKQNEPPVDAYRPYVINFLNTHKNIEKCDHDDLFLMNLFYDEEKSGNKVVDLRDDDVSLKSYLFFNNYDKKQISISHNSFVSEDTIEFTYVTLNIKFLKGYVIDLIKCNINVEEIEADDILLKECKINSSIILKAQIITIKDVDIRSSSILEIECDKLKLEKVAFLHIGNSNIDSISSKDFTKFYFYDNVSISHMNMEEYKIERFGENNKFNILSLCNSVIKEIPDNFKAKMVEFQNLIQFPTDIGNDVKIEKVQFNSPCSFYKEDKLKSAISALKKCNTKEVFFNYKEIPDTWISLLKNFSITFSTDDFEEENEEFEDF